MKKIPKFKIKIPGAYKRILHGAVMCAILGVPVYILGNALPFKVSGEEVTMTMEVAGCISSAVYIAFQGIFDIVRVIFKTY